MIHDIRRVSNLVDEHLRKHYPSLYQLFVDANKTAINGSLGETYKSESSCGYKLAAFGVTGVLGGCSQFRWPVCISYR